MNVFFTASHRGHTLYEAQLNQIHDILKSFNSVQLIAPGWDDNYSPLVTKNQTENIVHPRQLHWHAVREGIKLADAVIMETSHESFQLGHEATLALLEKKPVLCLSIHENFHYRITHELYSGSQYTPETVKPIIQDFLAKVRNLSLSKRFNLFLYPHQIDHIQAQAKSKGMDASEYLRSLINSDKKNQI